MATRRHQKRRPGSSRHHRRHSTRRIQYRQRGGNKVLMKHIMDFNASKTHPGVYCYMDEDNINHGYAMIVGPRYPAQSADDKKTAKYPYEESLFFFELNFPSDYPARPPHVTFLNSTLDPENLRIHPNLYQRFHDSASSGKVCLSILGTWAGPGWESTMNLESTLMTVQSLLGPNPIHNEPGFERLAAADPRTLSYNHTVQHKAIEFSYNVFKMVVADYARESAARSEARAAVGPRGGAGGPVEENNNYVEFESTLPVFIKPFYDDLKGRMWNTIQFYIRGKLDVMIDMHTADPPGIGKVQTVRELHHEPRIVDYAKLLEQVMALRVEIPEELRVASAIENASVKAELNEAKKKAREEKAAKNAERRAKILQNLKDRGQNINANFIKEQDTQSLSNYLNRLKESARENAAADANNNEYQYPENE